MSANPAGSSLTIEWVSRMESLERDNNKLKSQLDEIKGKYKDIAVEKKAQEREDARVARENEKNLRAQRRDLEGIAATVRGAVIGSFTALTGGILTANGAIALMKQLMADVAKNAHDAAEAMKSADPSRRNLLSHVGPAGYRAALRSVESLRRQEGMSEASAVNLYIAASRSGKTDILPFLGTLGDIGIEAEPALTAFQYYQRNFGRRNVPQFKTFLNSALAAEQATGVRANDIMTAAGTAARSVGRMSDDELTAMTAVMGRRMGTGPGALLTRNAVMKLSTIRKHVRLDEGESAMSDLDLVERLEEFESAGRIVDDKGKRTTLDAVLGHGAAKARRDLEILRAEMNAIREVQRAILYSERQGGRSFLNNYAGFVTSDPTLAATDLAESISGTHDVERDRKLGLAQTYAEALIKEKIRVARAGGSSELAISAMRMAQESTLLTQGADEYLRQQDTLYDVRNGVTVSPYSGKPLGVNPDLIRSIEAYNENTSALRDLTDTLKRAGAPSASDPRVDR